MGFWVRIRIQTSSEAEDAVSNLLMELGSGGVHIDDEGKNKISIKAYFPPDDMLGERVLKVQKLLEELEVFGINVGAGRISFEKVDEKEWTEPWKEFFKPLTVGRRIIVFPSWEMERAKSPEREIMIQIDPGMAFGTGRHSTSLLCLEFLEENIKGNESVLDIGTGSGILAIASVKLGAARVVAIDVDRRAVSIARENSQLNGVRDRISVICADGLGAVIGKYEIIVANISTKIILSMIPDLVSYLTEKGKLILSGILASEASEIQRSLEENGLTVVEIRQNEEWAAFLVKSK